MDSFFLDIGLQMNRLPWSLRGSFGLSALLEAPAVDVNGEPIGSVNYYNMALQASVAYLLFD